MPIEAATGRAVEITIRAWLFEPFRAAGYTDQHVVNDKAFKPYMRRERELTLGNYPFLFSSREAAFRQHVMTIYPDADRRLFDGAAGVLAYLGPDEIAGSRRYFTVRFREEVAALRRDLGWHLTVITILLAESLSILIRALVPAEEAKQFSASALLKLAEARMIEAGGRVRQRIEIATDAAELEARRHKDQ